MTVRTVIETERLWLREYAHEDAAEVLLLGSNPLVQKYTGEPLMNSLDEAKAMLARPIADYRRHGFGRWAVVSKATGRLVGFAGLKYLDELQEVDLGYRLLPEFWGMGLATEAAQGSLRYGFETLKLARIIGLVDPANVRSVRVLEKCGFEFEKIIDYRSEPAAQYATNGNRPSQPSS